MTNPGYTHLTLVVDRSGSMSDIREDAQGGVTTLLTEQFAEPGKLTVTVVEFDEHFDDIARTAFGRGALAVLKPGTKVCWAVDPNGPACADAEEWRVRTAAVAANRAEGFRGSDSCCAGKHLWEGGRAVVVGID